MRTWILTLTLAVVAPLVGGQAAFAADVVGTTRAKVDHVEDGTVLVQLVVSPEKKGDIMRLPFLLKGLPTTPGRLGVVKNEIYGMCKFAPGSQVEKDLQRLQGELVDLSFDKGQFIVKVDRASPKN